MNVKASDVGAGTERARGGFDTTQWGLVARADATATLDRCQALEELCRIYWFPIYCFARRRGARREDAQDLVQGFFADLLARGAVARADVTRGRFRTFLLCSFQHYCGHERERADAAKRGGGQRIVSLDALMESAENFDGEPASSEVAEQFFDRKWAVRLIERALSTVRAECVAAGKEALFDALKPVIWGEESSTDYAALAMAQGKSEGAIKVHVHRIRRRLALEIRSEVARTVMDPAMVVDEMNHLLAAVAR